MEFNHTFKNYTDVEIVSGFKKLKTHLDPHSKWAEMNILDNSDNYREIQIKSLVDRSLILINLKQDRKDVTVFVKIKFGFVSLPFQKFVKSKAIESVKKFEKKFLD